MPTARLYAMTLDRSNQLSNHGGRCPTYCSGRYLALDTAPSVLILVQTRLPLGRPKETRSFTWLGGESSLAALRPEACGDFVQRTTKFRNEDRCYPHDVCCQLPRSNACTLNIDLATSKNGNVCIDTSSPLNLLHSCVYVASAICTTTAGGSSPLTDGKFEVAGSVTRPTSGSSFRTRERVTLERPFWLVGDARQRLAPLMAPRWFTAVLVFRSPNGLSLPEEESTEEPPVIVPSVRQPTSEARQARQTFFEARSPSTRPA